MGRWHTTSTVWTSFCIVLHMENAGKSSIRSTVWKSCQSGMCLFTPKNFKTNNPSYLKQTATLPDKGRRIRGHCWVFLSTCPSTQHPLAVQGKLTTRLGSLRLDQDELRLAPEVRIFPSSIMSYKWTDRAE